MSKDDPLWIATLGIEDGQAVAYAAKCGSDGSDTEAIEQYAASLVAVMEVPR